MMETNTHNDRGVVLSRTSQHRHRMTEGGQGRLDCHIPKSLLTEIKRHQKDGKHANIGVAVSSLLTFAFDLFEHSAFANSDDPLVAVNDILASNSAMKSYIRSQSASADALLDSLGENS